MSNYYDSYGDWYDNGPGSESFERQLREMYKNYTKNVKGFPWYEGKENKNEEFIKDEDVLI